MLAFLSYIYMDIAGGTSFFKKNSFPPGDGVETVIVIQNEKTKVYFPYYGCRYGWNHERLSTL